MDSSMEIKSGTDIVDDFLKTIGAKNDIDAETLEIVQELVATESLTVTRLLQGLASSRDKSQDSEVPADAESGHDN